MRRMYIYFKKAKYLSSKGTGMDRIRPVSLEGYTGKKMKLSGGLWGK